MNEKLLYLECNSGISGDMTVGALLDLGADEEVLRQELKKLPVDGYKIEVGRTNKCGIDSCKFEVKIPEEHHHHRSYLDIQNMLQNSELKKEVKQRAQKIFYVLAKAEAKVHGVTRDAVHFHEVGAIDSIVDIVGTAICLDDLGITDVAVSTMTEGCGTTWCQHGVIPVPVPAVTELVAEYGLPMKLSRVPGEMITPTGAAIVAAMRTRDVMPESFVIKKIGIGAGTKDFPHANILRAMLVEETGGSEDIWVLETNVDDCAGEQLGFLQEHLMAAGARDVYCRTAYMKKSRPAYQLTVLCEKELIVQMEDLIFRESTSIGIRKYPAGRTVLERSIESVETDWGPVQVKICRYAGQAFVYPEYESVKLLAEKAGCGYKEMYDRIKGIKEDEFTE